MADAKVEFRIHDLNAYLEQKDEQSYQQHCADIANDLHQFGILIVKDPRVSMEDNDRFIDMMEQYFEQPLEQKLKDVRKEVYYQVGATPDHVEQARDHCSKVEKLPETDRPVTICPPGLDPKWRYFWRIGDRPEHTNFAQLNADPVVPQNFPQWPDVMNAWGTKILSTVKTVSEMAALGFKLPKDTFASLLNFGPHLLAPTGSDLKQWGNINTVFASFHYDLNFMTIHGRSRFPGLFVWTREGKRVLVRVPQNCLLLQAGKQFEWLTGGEVLAGFHEVVVCPETITAVEKAKAENRSLWRVSSTLFSHVASDNILQPLAHFATENGKQLYPAVTAGQQVQNELNAIKLGVKPTDQQDTPVSLSYG